jgi:hypothetical protein
MSKLLKSTFAVHSIVALVFGAALLLAPGRTLDLFSWQPQDALITRLFGAALLALAWSSFRGWQSDSFEKTVVLVEMETVFTVFGCLGLLRHLLKGAYPAIVYAIFALLFVFAVLWVVNLIRRK